VTTGATFERGENVLALRTQFQSHGVKASIEKKTCKSRSARVAEHIERRRGAPPRAGLMGLRFCGMIGKPRTKLFAPVRVQIRGGKEASRGGSQL
jgi:hypothetical protein